MRVAQNDGMQGIFPKRGTLFNVTVYNDSYYSWIPSSSSMSDFHEQAQGLLLFFTWGTYGIFSLMRKKVGTQPDSDGSVISGLGVINLVLGLHFKAVWQLTLSQYPTAHQMPTARIMPMCCQQHKLLPDFKEMEVFLLFIKTRSLTLAEIQLWMMCLQLTGTAWGVHSPGLGSQARSCIEKVTGYRVQMTCSSFHWIFSKVMHWIKTTENCLKGCKRS